MGLTLTGIIVTHGVKYYNNNLIDILVPDLFLWPKTGVKEGILSKNRQYTRSNLNETN